MKLKTVLVAIIAGLATNAATAQPVGPYDSADWVGQVYQSRSNTTLRQMVIPGTHDSGTYNINAASALSPDANYIYNFAKEAAAEWAKTQSYNFTDMLNMGIRHFDLRIKKHQGEFVIVHGLVGMKVIDLLSQVKAFAQSHPKEPIILEVAKTPDSADLPALLDLFDQYVGNRKPDNSVPAAQLTLTRLWAADNNDGVNNNIVVIWAASSADGKARGYYGGEELEGTWANTESSTTLHDRLLNGWVNGDRVYKGLKNAPTDKLFYSAFTFTPKDSTVIEDALNPFGDISLLSWTRDWMRSYLGSWVPGWVAAGYRPNIMTADFFEYTAMVPQAIQLNTVAPPAPSDKLKVAIAPGYDAVWNDDDSGADSDGAIFKLKTAPGYKPLSYIPTSSWHFDHNLELLLVKENQPGVVRPLGYNWVYNDNDSGAKVDVSIWRPIAPAGYVCLGDVATTNHGIAPSTDLIRCVHQSYVEQAPNIVLKWTDKGSGGKYDGSFWDSYNPNGTTHNIGSLRGNRSHGQPASELFKLLSKSKTEFYTDSGFNEINALGKCIEPNSDSFANGTNVHLWDCNNSDRQQWSFDSVTGLIRNKHNPNYCLDSTGATGNFDSVTIYQCVDHINLKWTWNGTRIKPQVNPSLSLDVYLANPTNGTDIIQYQDNSTVAQIFTQGQ